VWQAVTFSYGVVLWEIITRYETTSRSSWRPLRVPEECPAEVAALLRECLQASSTVLILCLPLGECFPVQGERVCCAHRVRDETEAE